MKKIKSLILTQEDKIFFNFYIKYLQERLVSLSGSHRVVPLGSVMRGTALRNYKFDLDFFVYYLQFDKEIFINDLKKLFPYAEIYLKHRGFPYCTIVLNVEKTIVVDVVPCIVNDKIQKSNTQLHHEYMMSHLTDDLRQTIVYSKYLIRRIGLYDADSAVKGFSGFCVECLILRYGQLQKVPDDLDYLPDPVDKTRNLLASVSPENLQRFFVLKHNKFRKIFSEDSEFSLYMLKNAPLKLFYSVKKDPNVVNCVYVRGALLVELKDHFVKPKSKLSYDSLYWATKDNQSIYTTVLNGMKKISKESFFKRYLYEFIQVGYSKEDLRWRKTYNFFR